MEGSGDFKICVRHWLLCLLFGGLTIVGCPMPHSSGVSRNDVHLAATVPVEPPAQAYQDAVRNVETAAQTDKRLEDIFRPVRTAAGARFRGTCFVRDSRAVTD